MKNAWLALSCALVAWAAVPLQAQPRFNDDAIVRVAATHGTSVEQGTGFLMSADGLIATAYHVIHRASRIDVYVRGGSPVTDVTVVAIRPDADLALLRIPSDRSAGFYPVSATAAVGGAGDPVYVHGHPLGFPKQVLTGTRTQQGYLPSQLWTDDAQNTIFAVTNLNLLPVDVTAEPGLSGSPVVDASGRVVAVFSGSLRRGRGYSWGIPIDYLRTADMQRVDQRASLVRWPAVVKFMKPGLELERGRTTATGTQVWQICRQRVDTLSDSWNAYHGSQIKLAMPLSIAEPTLASTRRQLTRANAAQLKARLGSLWQWIEPDFNDVATSYRQFQSALGDTLARCTGESVLRMVATQPPPGTYENILASKRFGQRLGEISARLKASADKQREREQTFSSVFDRMFDAGAVVDQPGADDYQLTLSLLEIMEAVIELQREAGPGEVEHASNVISFGLSMAEALQRIEEHEWETTYRAHQLSVAGLTVTLDDGWLPFDARLRAGVLAPGVTLPEYIQIISFGQLDEDEIPVGLAEVRGMTAGVDFSSPSSQPSDQTAFRLTLLDGALTDALRREGMRLSATPRKAQTTVDGDLVLEATGVGTLPNRPEMGVYVALRFHGNRVATLTCFLTEAPWNEYRACTRLIDGVTFNP